MKHLFVLSICLLSIFSSLFAQVNDNFADGDFSNNPTWSGDDALWVIDDGKLRSNNSGANTYYLSTASSQATEAQWTFWIDLQFATSGSNYVDVFLTADNANLNAANNGYFLRIGDTQDEIVLYKLIAGVETALIDNLEGVVNSSSSNIFRIKVSRNASNLWRLEYDDGDTGTFVLAGSASDNSLSTSTAFGFKIIQSSAASPVNSHFFDDVVVEDIVLDTTPPTLSNLSVSSANTLELQFSEALSSSTAQNTANYSVDNGIGNPSTALQDPSDLRLVTLSFASSFVSGNTNTLTISNLEDLSNNVIAATTENFTYLETFAPTYHEILISEIMADPSGSAQPLNPLPEAEFIELYNASDRALALEDCQLIDATASFDLPAKTLLPGEYLIICDDGDAAALANFGEVLAISSFPSLSNGGEMLQIRNASNALVFAVDYRDTWYRNDSKAEGGWTLEMIDVNYPCGEAENWRASEAERGGTPGKPNSVQSDNADIIRPRLLRAEAINATRLRLTFSEAMSVGSLNTASYSLSPDLGIATIFPQEPLYKVAELQLNTPMQSQTTYQIAIEGLSDCAGNLIESQSLPFGLAELPDSGDVVINELLFNPYPNSTDFVEIYNRSDKFINLKDWKLANISDGIPANQQVISEMDLVMRPAQYLVFTENQELIISDYPASVVENFWEMNLPSYPDEEGNVLLISNTGDILDLFPYHEDFHFPLLDDVEGISLEKISFEANSQTAESWRSAASNLRATPGYLNSQSLQAEPVQGEISVSPKVFTPNNDGNQDFTQIRYQFAQSGYVMSISIYDRQGRKIRDLVENQVLGYAQGQITWDGTDEARNRVRMGYYLLFIKIFDLEGNQRVFKESVAVGRQF